MNYSNGYVKIYRSLCQWKWWKDQNTLQVYLYLLINANWKEAKFETEIVKRGQIITSYAKIAEENGLTGQNVRTALNHLEKTGEITRKPTNKYQLITVENYEFWQGESPEANKVANNQLTINQQSTNNQLTTIEEEKELDNKKTFSYSPPPASYWSQDPIEQRKQHDARMAELRKQFGLG